VTATATITATVVATVRVRDKLLGIDCTQIPINWNCHGGIYLELQFLRIATKGIAIPENCGLFGNKTFISKELLMLEH
jgi:hypothetical protein